MVEVQTRLAAALADRYTIERELGAGGMATVYLAQDLKHDRKVALKVLKAELAAVLGAERFVQEIKTTASLQHPNILPLFDSGEAIVPPLHTVERGTGGEVFVYYVMPYIEGETLREKLNRENQLSVEEAVKITTEVADALNYAHRNSVIHRDIKPGNILLHDGRPMVADFGIALAVSAAAGGRMTETGLSLGTPHYMSPEQATAEKDITAPSDVYSLGTVLYEMLTGEPPHTGGSAQQIIMKIVTEEARPVTELRKSVPPNVAAAVSKAMEKLAASPDGRWLAYASNESGQYEVYVRPFPNTNDGKLQVSMDGGIEPVWEHSGRELFYKESGRFIVVAVLPGATFVTGERRALFSAQGYRSNALHQNYDVTPDGQRFVMIRNPEAEKAGDLIVVENFFEELKAKVGN